MDVMTLACFYSSRRKSRLGNALRFAPLLNVFTQRGLNVLPPSDLRSHFYLSLHLSQDTTLILSRGTQQHFS